MLKTALEPIWRHLNVFGFDNTRDITSVFMMYSTMSDLEITGFSVEDIQAHMRDSLLFETWWQETS